MYSTYKSTFQGSQICEADSQDGATSDRNASSQTYQGNSDLPRQSTPSALEMPGLGEVQAPCLHPAARVVTGQAVIAWYIPFQLALPPGLNLACSGTRAALSYHRSVLSTRASGTKGETPRKRWTKWAPRWCYIL